MKEHPSTHILQEQLDRLVDAKIIPLDKRKKAMKVLQDYWKDKDMSGWSVDDVLEREESIYSNDRKAPPVLTRADALKILRKASENQNADQGITNEVIFDLIDEAREEKIKGKQSVIA